MSEIIIPKHIAMIMDGNGRWAKSTMSIISSNGLYNMDITPLDEIGRNLNNSRDFINRVYGKLGITFAPFLKYDLVCV